MTEIKTQRKESRVENLELQTEIKKHSEKIQELERVISHFNLGVNDHETPTRSGRPANQAIKLKMNGGTDGKHYFTPRH